MLIGTLGTTLLRNLLSGKGERSNPSWRWSNQSWIEFFMLRHSLNNFEMQMYYQSQLRFEGIYSRNNLRKTMKDEACVVNLDDYK